MARRFILTAFTSLLDSAQRLQRLLPDNFPKQHIIAVLGLSLLLTLLLLSSPDTEPPSTGRQALALSLDTNPVQQPIEPAPVSSTLRPSARLADINATKRSGQHPVETTAPLPDEPTSIPSNQASPSPASQRPDASVAESTAADLTQLNLQWQTVTVQTGDSLSKLFKRVGLNGRDLHRVMQNNDEADDLHQLFPGEELSFQIDGGALQALRYMKSPLETLHIERDNDSFNAIKTMRAPEVRQRFRQAIIQDSLFKAGDRADLPHGIIMELANIFSGVIDFVYDPRRGDTFSVLYEELYLDGKKYDDGKILAAHFTNRNNQYPAFRYTDKQGNTGYYNNDGISMRKAFLRAPVDFTRISSQFDPARLHPIFKTKRPHRGIDYAASRGTPIFATGDGRVTSAGYSRANGNYLVIAHGNQFITKYLHLHKKQVKKGQRVKQGQIIGQVGSTGYATGPHLHYEFLLNGVHRNPRTIHKKLPKAQSVAKAEMARFQATIAPMQAQLNDHRHGQVVAATDTQGDPNMLTTQSR